MEKIKTALYFLLIGAVSFAWVIAAYLKGHDAGRAFERDAILQSAR